MSYLELNITKAQNTVSFSINCFLNWVLLIPNHITEREICPHMSLHSDSELQPMGNVSDTCVQHKHRQV